MDTTFPPPSARVRVEFGANSRRGKSRKVNEDHYVILELGRHEQILVTSLPESALARRFDEYGYAMIVADGMGGSGSGETASRLAVATLVEVALEFGKWNLRIDDGIAREIISRAERFYRHVDAAVACESSMGPVPGLQSTLTAVFGAGRDLFFAHVGHSRAYLYRRGELMRLTRDHTVVNGEADAVPSRFSKVNVAARDLKHILTATIGMAGLTGPAIDLERFRLDDQDIVLVCTNGITDALGDEALGAVLALDWTPNDLSKKLVDLALEAGGEDDATALVGRYHIPSTVE